MGFSGGETLLSDTVYGLTILYDLCRGAYREMAAHCQRPR
jgi:hypothetical protein